MHFLEQHFLWSVGLALATHGLLALLWSEFNTKQNTVARGTFWINKVKGKLICSFVIHDGKASSFNCAEPERNPFIDSNGSIKNSDHVDW